MSDFEIAIGSVFFLISVGVIIWGLVKLVFWGNDNGRIEPGILGFLMFSIFLTTFKIMIVVSSIDLFIWIIIGLIAFIFLCNSLFRLDWGEKEKYKEKVHRFLVILIVVLLIFGVLLWVIELSLLIYDDIFIENEIKTTRIFLAFCFYLGLLVSGYYLRKYINANPSKYFSIIAKRFISFFIITLVAFLAIGLPIYFYLATGDTKAGLLLIIYLTAIAFFIFSYISSKRSGNQS